MAQKIYQGNDPFVFVSYSHKDREAVVEIINHLMLCACNLWYDTGIRSGEDWNLEIAQRLNDAECVLFMVTENSVASEYVKDELNFAKARHKKIYPVFLDSVELPLSLELALGRSQAISLKDGDVCDNRFKLREKILHNLPSNVFGALSDPFYNGEFNRYYLVDTTTQFPENTFFEGEDNNSFELVMESVETGKRETVYRYQSRPAYDMFYSINNALAFDDPYLNDSDSKILMLSLVLRFSSKGTVPWPDLDVVLTVSIARLESAAPRVSLVDRKALGKYTAAEEAFINCLLSEIDATFLPAAKK